MTKKIRFYDLTKIGKKIFENSQKLGVLPKKYHDKDLYIDERVFIIEGPNGIVISEEFEGVHHLKTSRSDTYKLRIHEKFPDGGHSLFPLGHVEMTIEEIFDYDPPYEEKDLKDAVRIFGDRLDSNWRLLLNACRKIGLDLDEYDTDRHDRGK